MSIDTAKAMTAQPYTKADLDVGERIVRQLHGLRGYDAWAERIAKVVAAERERCATIAETAPAECLQMWDRPGGPPGNAMRKTTGADIAKLIRRDPAAPTLTGMKSR